MSRDPRQELSSRCRKVLKDSGPAEEAQAAYVARKDFEMSVRQSLVGEESNDNTGNFQILIAERALKNIASIRLAGDTNEHYGTWMTQWRREFVCKFGVAVNQITNNDAG